MTPTKTLLTAEQFDNYPFKADKRYELDEGKLLEMTRRASWNNRVPKNLQFSLGGRADLGTAKVIHIIPEIASEVLSPNETTPRIHRQLKQYFAAGVKEIWLIDSEAGEAEIWTGPTLPEHTLSEADVMVSALLPGFALPLAEVFA